MKQILFVAALTMIITRPSLSAEWELDKSHSSVGFSVSHLVVAEVTGKFAEFDVTLQSEKNDFSDANVTAAIKTASITTVNQKRDGHLKSDDFLNAGEFPEITFVSRSIERTGDDRYDIAGDLTIRDVTRPVVLDTKFRGTIKDARGGTRAGFKATTTIDRFDYGVRWDSATEAGNLVAGRDVEITLLLEFKQKQ